MTTKTLRWLLIVMLLVVQAAVAMVVLFGMKDRTTTQLTENAQANLNRLGSAVANQADNFLAPGLAELRVGHRLVADGMLDPAKFRRLENFFLAELQANPTIAGLYVGRANGSFMMTTRNEAGVLSSLTESDGDLQSVLMTQRDNELGYLRTWVDSQNTIDPTQTPWYKAAKDKPGITVSPAHRVSHTGVPGISAAIELHYPDGSDAGVLGVDIDLQALSTFVAQSLASANASAVILDEHDQLVAWSRQEQLAAMPDETALPAFASIADEALQTIRRRIAADEQSGIGFTRAAHGAEMIGSGLDSFTVGQQPILGFVRTLPLAQGELNWTLLVQMPATEYAGGIGELFDAKLKVIVATLAVTVLISLLGYLGLSDPTVHREQDVGFDSLTGALTRPEFERRMHGVLDSRRETEADARIYLVALDLDGFKALNDKHGVPTGDLILARFVARLGSKMRDGDLIGRNGGDEFLLAVRFDRDVDVLATVERIREQVVKDGFRSKVGMHQLSFTAGVACFDADESLDSLISRANQALVTGKARGRNRCYLAPDHHAHWPETVVSAISAQHRQRRATKPTPAESQ